MSVSVQEIKDEIKGLQVADQLRRETLSLSFYKKEIPRGALTEVYGPLGSGKTEVILKLLVEHPTLKVAWIEPELTIYPCAFLQRPGLNYKNILFISAREHCLWAGHQALRSRLFDLVVLSCLPPHQRGEIEFRRLQIEARHGGGTVILLSEQATQESRHGRWAMTLQISAEPCLITTK